MGIMVDSFVGFISSTAVVEQITFNLFGVLFYAYPRGSIYTTIMEVGSQNHNEDGFLGPNSIMVAYMEPLGM